MIYGTGAFRIEKTNLGKHRIEKKSIGGWSAMMNKGKALEFTTKSEAEKVLKDIRNEWENR